MVLPAQVESPRAPRQVGHHTSAWLGAAALLVGATSALLYWNGRSTPPAAPARTVEVVAPGDTAPAGFDLVAGRKGRDLEITWNPSSPALTGATGGSLFVTDGGGRTQIFLEAAHLKSGRVLYVPRSNDIDVRLEITTADAGVLRESLRVLGAGRQTAAEPPRVRTPEAADAEPPAQAPVQSKPQPAQAPVGSARIEPAPEPVLGDLPRRRTIPESLMLRTIPAPREEPAAAVQRAAAQPTPQTTAAVRQPADAQPVAPATPPPAVTSTPVRTAAPFVPAAPLQKVPVGVPLLVRSLLAGEASIDVKVRIDETGRVTKAEPEFQPSPVNNHLAAAARSAALQWRFTAARIGDRAVASDYVIVFKFRR
jgi:hypothetical protein